MLCVGCAVQVKLRNEAGCLCCGKTVCCDMYERMRMMIVVSGGVDCN